MLEVAARPIHQPWPVSARDMPLKPRRRCGCSSGAVARAEPSVMVLSTGRHPQRAERVAVRSSVELGSDDQHDGVGEPCGSVGPLRSVLHRRWPLNDRGQRQAGSAIRPSYENGPPGACSGPFSSLRRNREPVIGRPDGPRSARGYSLSGLTTSGCPMELLWGCRSRRVTLPRGPSPRRCSPPGSP